MLPTVPFHTPVLLPQVLSLWAHDRDGTFVDATLGDGGHSEALFKHTGGQCRCYGFDADSDAIATARERLTQFGDRFVPIGANFGNLRLELHRRGVAEIDGILFDLGVSSRQLDDPSKGFSYRFNASLDMRMDRSQRLTAGDVVNTYSEQQLESVFRRYGEERFSRRIAHAIALRRTARPISTTADLAAVIKGTVRQALPVKSISRIFQALRIEVNAELDRLSEGLEQAHDLLRPGGRLVVISYHSLEDRIVKTFFRKASTTVSRSGVPFVPDKQVVPTLRVLTRKPIEPSRGEIQSNPRARSAKLRAAEKV